MSRIPTGKPNGRPIKEIDWNLVDELLESGAPGTEIAPHFNMHPDTFYRKVEEEYKMGFSDYSSIKKYQGQSNLRLAQYRKAIGKSNKGDNTLLIWLGKQRLDQKENATQVFVSEDVMQKHEAMMQQLEMLQSERKRADTNINTE